MKFSTTAKRAASRLSVGTSWPLVLAAVTVVAVGTTAVHSLSESGTLGEQRWRNTQTLLGLERVTALLADAESAGRGYIITGRPAYLEPYVEAGRRLSGALSDLETTLPGQPEQLAGVSRLRPLIKDKLAELSHTIALRREGRTEEVMSMVGSDHGRFLMARIRDEAERLSQRALAFGEERNRAYESSVRWSFLVVIGGSALLFVLTAFATMTTARELRARSKAEQAARHRGERYRSLVDASSQVVWTADRGGAMVDGEGAWAALTGQSRAELAGTGWLAAVHPEDRERTRRGWEAATATNEVFSLEHRIRRQDGLYRTFGARAVPVCDDEGQTREWVGVHTDITERERGEQRLRFLAEVSALLASPLELETALGRLATLSVPNFADWCSIDVLTGDRPVRLAVACADPRKEELAARLRKLGPAEDEEGGIAEVLRTGRPSLVLAVDPGQWEKIASPERRAAVMALGIKSYIMAPVRARGRVVGVLTWGVAESGKSLGNEDLAFGLEVASRTGAAIDRARLLSETEAARSLLDAIFEAAPVGLALFDDELRFSRINAALSRLNGLPAEAHLGKRLRDVLPGMDPALEGALREVQAQAQPLERELRVRPASSHDERILLTRCSPADRAGVIAVFMDITERKRAEAERERLVRALARSNQDLNEFAYVASHDLKAPLRGITNLSEWLDEDLGPDIPAAAREKLVLMRGRARRLEGLIDGILDYSRAGRARSAAALVDVRALLGEVVDLLGPAAAQAVVVREGAWPALLTERAALEQVFMNLVSNALKHAGRLQPAGALRIEVAVEDRPAGEEREGGQWVFSVRDNGPGIAPQYHDRIWGIFQTLEARDKVEGAGIGLAVVKKIVENEGGRVWVESAEGRGACFCFTWPRSPRAEVTRGEARPSRADDERQSAVIA
jgi:PAS domain S-box-containing protein